MADTITLQIDSEKAEELRKIAAERGESYQEFAQRLFEDAIEDVTGPEGLQSLLSPEQQADLRERLRNPGPNATEEEVEAFFAHTAQNR